MIRLIIYFSCAFLAVLFFKQIDATLLNWNFSWTISKIAPYFILIVIGLLLAFEAIKKAKLNNKIIFKITAIILFLLPISIGFYLNPIYQGDFSKNGDVLKNKQENRDFNEDGLSVLTIPGCHFCFESIEKLKKIKKRNPNLSITYIVCSRDPKSLENYRKELNGQFNLKLAVDPDNLAILAQMKFPAYLQIKNNKPIYRWSNDQFGVRAIDLLESLKK